MTFFMNKMNNQGCIVLIIKQVPSECEHSWLSPLHRLMRAWLCSRSIAAFTKGTNAGGGDGDEEGNGDID
jgi:hypothetical protein